MLSYSSNLGGKGEDYGTDIAVDDFGCAYVTGEAARKFPITANSLQSAGNILKSYFLNIYNNTVSNIHIPRDIGITSDKVMAGPNNDLFNPDFSVGEMMGIEFNVETSENPRRDMLVVDNKGSPLEGAQTILQKSGISKTIAYGSTNNAGRIKLFDAAVGDTILSTHQSLNNCLFNRFRLEQALINGCDDFISKPIDSARLVYLINKYVHKFN